MITLSCCPLIYSTKWEYSWDVGLIHSDYMACPSKLVLIKQRLYTKYTAAIKDFKVWYFVIPFDFVNTTKTFLMKSASAQQLSGKVEGIYYY